MYEKPEVPPIPKIYEIDISEAWDMQSQIEEFQKKLIKLPFYKPNLLYSGFDGESIGKTWHSASEESTVFCNTEDKIDYNNGDIHTNPFNFAFNYDSPAIAVYDPKKLEQSGYKSYIIKDKTALIAIIKFNS